HGRRWGERERSSEVRAFSWARDLYGLLFLLLFLFRLFIPSPIPFYFSDGHRPRTKEEKEEGALVNPNERNDSCALSGPLQESERLRECRAFHWSFSRFWLCNFLIRGGCYGNKKLYLTLEVKVATPKEEMRGPVKKATRIFVARISPSVTEAMFRRIKVQKGIEELALSLLIVRNDDMRYPSRMAQGGYGAYNAYISAATRYAALGAPTLYDHFGSAYGSIMVTVPAGAAGLQDWIGGTDLTEAGCTVSGGLAVAFTLDYYYIQC
ncbi:hypothetical protein BHE74_00038491, partial [Ensete ventricosum]